MHRPMDKVLIVGNGYAGLQAARTLAALEAAAVTLVTAEPHPAYCPHLLPELVARRKEREDLYLPDSDVPSRGAVARTGVRVAKLCPRTRKALLSTGEEISFDKALIATGSRTSVPEALRGPLREFRNVVALKRMDDALALRDCLGAGSSRLVIVGAGRIGVLLAEALKESGVTVSLVEIAPEILPTMLERDVAAKLRAGLERRNVAVRTGSRVAGVTAEGGRVVEVVLADGDLIPCDAVAVATGVEPETDFLDGGVGGPGGIPVNAAMETSMAGIYAAGDVVRFETMTGKVDVGQLVMNARAQGEVAARNIAGGKASCPPAFIGNVVRIGSMIGARVGDVEGTDRIDARTGGSFLRCTLDGQAVAGIQFVGDPEDLKGLAPAVLKRLPSSEVARWLKGFREAGFAPLFLAGGGGWA